MPEATDEKPGRITATLEAIGGVLIRGLEYIGSLYYLAADVMMWVGRAFVARKLRLGREALLTQIVRIGLRSVTIITLISACIGLILSLQMAPPLQNFGQVEKVANIIGIAVLRELGPLISAIVLTGFAGASMAAELGTMVVGEEIEALESMALNPTRFLVVPRVLATIISLIILCVIGDLAAILAAAGIGALVLDIPLEIYRSNLLDQVKMGDFLSGLIKAGVFGMLIALIACYNGLKVSGGAAGVGRATTITVVHSILAIILADLLFTTLFYALHWT